MKKIKILLPLITVTSATAVVAPVITSCGKKEGIDNETLRQYARKGLDTAFLDATSRQPEAFDMLLAIYKPYNEYLKTEKSGHRCIGVSVMASGAIEAIGRQPEAEKDIKFQLNKRFISLRDNDEYMSMAIGQASYDESESIGRQPEAKWSIVNVVNSCIQNIQLSTCYDEAIGIGLVGGQAAQAVARQPEAESIIIGAMAMTIDACHRVYENGNKTVNDINKQELYNKLEHTHEQSNDWPSGEELYYLFSDGKAIDIGCIGNSLMEAIARQPEAEQTLQSTASKWYDIIERLNVLSKVRFCGLIGSQSVEGIARMPESSSAVNMLISVFANPYIRANETRSRYLEDVIYRIGEGYYRQPGDAEDQYKIKAAITAGKAMNEIVDAKTDAIASQISTLTYEFLWSAFNTDWETMDEYTIFEEEFLALLEEMKK